MGVVQTLRNRGSKTGVSVRPRENDGIGPPGGTKVSWAVAQPIQDLIVQGKKLGWGHLGEIGDFGHLKKHGDHTPWSQHKAAGVVYAKDTSEPPWVEKELLKLCRREDYDTTWIDFFNINGRQFDFAGRLLGGSDDSHLHISVRKGAELRHVTLFTDLNRAHSGQVVGDFLMALSSREQRQLLKNVSETRFMLGGSAADIGHPFQQDRKDFAMKLDAILQAVRGDADADKILAGIRAEEEKTRGALLAKIDEIATGLASSVVEQLEVELNETEIAEALAAELAAHLTD
ncbi:MAG: hypothetical protein ACRDT4_17840 [Micromonosporaceae bacterium]